jgi:thiamine pyrophosphokinase
MLEFIPQNQEVILIIGGSSALIDGSIKKIYSEFINNQNCIEIYAVDKGLELIHNLGYNPAKIIGDFDSVNTEILKLYPQEKQIKFDPVKDLSDSKLAVNMALETEANSIYLLNMDMGRIDHTLFNIFLLKKAPIRIQMITSDGILYCLPPKNQLQIKISIGATFSLIPLSNIKHLTIKNALYELESRDITQNSLTLSNVSNGNVNIFYEDGALLIYILNTETEG